MENGVYYMKNSKLLINVYKFALSFIKWFFHSFIKLTSKLSYSEKNGRPSIPLLPSPKDLFFNNAQTSPGTKPRQQTHDLVIDLDHRSSKLLY